MRTISTALAAALALAVGALLHALFSAIEVAAGGGPLLAVLVEEGGKTLFLLGLALASRTSLGRRLVRAFATARDGAMAASRALSFGLVAITCFATVENLSYFAAFPGSDILVRLLWSEPVHLVSALAEALAVAALAGGCRGGAGRKGSWRALPLLAFAFLWHALFNTLAGLDSLPGGAGGVKTVAPAAAANAAALIVLARYFAQRVIVRGFLYGD